MGLGVSQCGGCDLWVRAGVLCFPGDPAIVGCEVMLMQEVAPHRFEVQNAQDDFRCRCGKTWTREEADRKRPMALHWDDGPEWYFCGDGKTVHAAFRWVQK